SSWRGSSTAASRPPRAARPSSSCRSSGRSSGLSPPRPPASRSARWPRSPSAVAAAGPMATDPIVELDAQDGVAWLRLNRPQALHALNRLLTQALGDALERVAAMDEVRVLVVAGRGRAFCAGNDIKEMQTVTPDDAEALARRHAAIMARFSSLPQVTIAAVDGYAL